MKSLLLSLFFAGSTFGALCQTPGLTAPALWSAENVPFSFTYNGKDSAQLLVTWKTSQENVTGQTGELHRYTYTDPATHLKVIAEVRLYPDFPDAIDWVLKFRNDGTADTPIIENILPLHWTIPASPGECVIRHAKGSDGKVEDFTPLEEHLDADDSDHFESTDGRSSSGDTLPFFNLQTGDHGLIGAIGWSGNWKADFAHAADGKTIAMASGMKQTHLLLHPGEEIRTPRIVLMRWTGDNWQDSQNTWRRLLFAHYTPQENGKPMRGPVLFGSWGSEPIAHKLALIQWVHEHKIPMDVYAIDAGWYGASRGPESTMTWRNNRGDWFPSPFYYPNGIKPLGAALKADHIGFSVWIEPETTMVNKKIINDHPDWFIHRNPPAKHDAWEANLGNPAARRGITEMVSNFITDFGMTWYRQDSNEWPEPFWKMADTPDRMGMTEIGHIEGLYQMWDDLLAQHPGLRIDNCAGGGRRLDIEMMSRSFSIWRTDYGFKDSLAEQAQTQALAYWVPENMGFPVYGAGYEGSTEGFEIEHTPWTKPGPYSTPAHLYFMRLAYDAGYGITPGAAGVNNDAWVAWVKQALAEYREVRPYFYGDFYPLLPYSLGDDTWTGWQWDRPDHQDGLVIVLRRSKSPFTKMELGLRHLNPDALYEVEIRSTYDKGPIREMKGRELAHLRMDLEDAPSSKLIFYRKK